MNAEQAMSLIPRTAPFRGPRQRAECAALILESCATPDEAGRLVRKFLEARTWPGLAEARELLGDEQSLWKAPPPAELRLAAAWRELLSLPLWLREEYEGRARVNLSQLAAAAGCERVNKPPFLIPNLQQDVIHHYLYEKQEGLIAPKGKPS